MIEAVLIFNIHGLLRLTKFYRHYPEQKQQQIVKEIYQMLQKKSENVCNFVEAGGILGDKNVKIIFRHYATLYIVFCVDDAESELGTLDLIQVFVETLDRSFKNVCELDLVFHVDKVHYILNEIITGGLVTETSIPNILTAFEEQKKLEKNEIHLWCCILISDYRKVKIMYKVHNTCVIKLCESKKELNLLNSSLNIILPSRKCLNFNPGVLS